MSDDGRQAIDRAIDRWIDRHQTASWLLGMTAAFALTFLVGVIVGGGLS